MRLTRFALAIIALGLAAPAFAQTREILQIEVAGDIRQLLVPEAAPYTNGGLDVPARPLKPGVAPRVSQFRIRAWTEAAGGGVRVAVFALATTRTRVQLTPQIASVVVRMNQSVEIATTEKFNARRITLKVIDGNSAPRPTRRVTPPAVQPAIWRIAPYVGDVPTDPAMRPWQPPPRGSR